MNNDQIVPSSTPTVKDCSLVVVTSKIFEVSKGDAFHGDCPDCDCDCIDCD